MISRFRFRDLYLGWIVVTFSGALPPSVVEAQPSLASSAAQAQSKIVKIYGAGGAGGLDAFQSGFLVSEAGHVATIWSTVLDVTPIVVLGDGRKFDGQIIGFEPSLGLAVLKIETGELPFFRVPADNADGTPLAQWGDPVLAMSNLFNIAQG